MSIYASWPPVGEYDEDHPACGRPDMRSHVYPDPVNHPPASVGISHIPGFIWRTGLPEERRDQDEDDPVAPYVRLHVCAWDEKEGRPMIVGDAVLTRPAAEKLRDQLTEWLARPMHDQ